MLLPLHGIVPRRTEEELVVLNKRQDPMRNERDQEVKKRVMVLPTQQRHRNSSDRDTIVHRCFVLFADMSSIAERVSDYSSTRSQSGRPDDMYTKHEVQVAIMMYKSYL